ncbi:MAG: FliM/FliN family flagellar motor C-terminal domain-containing protein [Anaerohalosphaeraceae bacterium]|nr:FliM/FliN family flagellar motor C-terminal domain-containing protein [Anaerohalosphaeraceae bacterium]
MNTPGTNNISKEKLQQLLSAINPEAAGDAQQYSDAPEYDWNQPHYFNKVQLNLLKNFAEKTVKQCAENFTKFFNNDFDTIVVSTTQHFADDIFAADSKKDNYYVVFGKKGQPPLGLLSIPLQSAAVWTARLLGSSDSEGEDEKTLSNLEESLLMDTASVLVKAISDTYGDDKIRPGQNITRGLVPLELEPNEEFYKITFSTKKADSEESSQADFIMFSSQLESVAGQCSQDEVKLSPKQNKNAVLNNFHNMPITVKAQLTKINLNFGQIMDMEIGDVLLLDKMAGDPADIIVEEQTLLSGWPAKSGGNYAIVIKEICKNK